MTKTGKITITLIKQGDPVPNDPRIWKLPPHEQRETRAGSKYVSVFKRLETNDEFIKRLRAKLPDFPWIWNDEELDNEAWKRMRMQRRIVEDCTER